MTRRTSSKDCGLNLVRCLALHLLWVVAVSSIEVKVDYTGHVQQGGAMPDDVTVTVSTGTNTTAILRLSRVPHINLDFPLYTLNHDGTGTLFRRRERRATKKMIAFYQDMATKAVFQITRNENHKNNTDLFKVKGEFRMPGKSFFLKSEKRRKRNFKSTATSTTQKSTSTDSSTSISDDDDEVYSLEVQKVQRPTTDVVTEAHLDSKDQEMKNDTRSTISPETDQMINLSSDQSPIPSDSNGSSGKPDTFAKLRRRRRSATTISIDVAAVVDYTLYLKFLTAAGNDRTAALQNIREYFAFIFNGADQRYQNLNANYIIHIYLSQVFVVESGSTSPLADTNNYPTNSIASETALRAFKNFVTQRGKDMLTSYDHAMLFTASFLTNGNGLEIVGIGYIASLCKTDGTSVSVITDLNDYRSIATVAQQLGSRLSAQNDGDGNSCSSSEGYIMSDANRAGTDPSQNHYWQFSSCSVAYFTSFLQQQMMTSQGVACLTGHPPLDNTIPDVSGRLLGQEIPPDQQCQATLGPDYKVCGSLKTGSALCHALDCLNTRTGKCIHSNEALDGTSCGNAKICRSGLCVSDPQAPTMDESCMFGDLPGIVYEGMTCSRLVQNASGACYISQILPICCKSCRAVHRNVEGCEYGDRKVGCTPQLCSQYPVDCCGTCNIGVPFNTKQPSVVTYAPRPPKQIVDPTDDVCRNREWSCYFLTDDAVTQCYDGVFNKKCCQFCQQHRSKLQGCEYGDRTPELCKDKSVCHSNTNLCCQLCTISSGNTIGYSGALIILAAVVIFL